MADPITVRIQLPAGMSNTTYHRRCESDGQRSWWIMDQERKAFVYIGYHRGDRPLDVTVELVAGRKYVVGCGPMKHGTRKRFVFGASDALTIANEHVS